MLTSLFKGSITSMEVPGYQTWGKGVYFGLRFFSVAKMKGVRLKLTLKRQEENGAEAPYFWSARL